ncbi:YbaB/EbfC family nucleoid-associated protein [Nonomuraea sp. LPB2021202275-12-8]|uniref:YbaB/EbfC family nucleoid-associated protein n=1 Tax=Nonomuraea sp. LPB2021202275-12-8 TaxID=3120159 RepID=UPI00300C1F14
MHSGDFHPDDLDRMVHESESSMRELSAALEGLGSVTGEGESRSGAIAATIGPDGRLDRIRLTPKASRMDLDELETEIVEAVRAAQDDQDGKAGAMLGPRPDPGLSMDRVRSQFEQVQDSFSREMGERLARLEAMRRRDD